MAKLANDVMTADPTRCSATTTLDEVAKLMRQFDCGEIPIVDTADRPIGVVTDRDIVCRIVAEGQNPAAHTAEQCMTSPVITVTSRTPVRRAAALMKGRSIGSLVVTSANGKVAGIVTVADLLDLLAREPDAEFIKQRRKLRDLARKSDKWED